jgi:hypothetical protein
MPEAKFGYRNEFRRPMGVWEVQTVCRLCASFHSREEERDETNRLTVGQPAPSQVKSLTKADSSKEESIVVGANEECVRNDLQTQMGIQ